MLEELLNQFPDKTIQAIISEAYSTSQQQNKLWSDSIFSQFLLLKQIYPNIDIHFDPTKKNSYFSPSENAIYLTYNSSGTFFHELTHLLSYNDGSLYFDSPEYTEFKNNFCISRGKDMIVLLEYIDKAIEALPTTEKIIEPKYNNLIQLSHSQQNGNKKFIQNSVYAFSMNKLDVFGKIEDIIDAISDGRSETYGLKYVPDPNKIVTKHKRADGHGCEYFGIKGAQLEEIVADWQAINLIDPHNQAFSLLKNLMGERFVSYLDQRCEHLNGISNNYVMDTNNNIHK